MSIAKYGALALTTMLWLMPGATGYAQKGNEEDPNEQSKEEARSLYEDNELAQSVIEAYRNIETYRAVWELRWDEGAIDAHEAGEAEVPRVQPVETRDLIEVAFDRDQNKAMYVFKRPPRNDQPAWAFLVMYDGERIHQARVMAEEADGKGTRSRRPKQPAKYGAFRRAIFPEKPVDLPLVWPEAPLRDLRAGRLSSVTTLPALKGNAPEPPELRVRHEIDSTEGRFTALIIDPETNRIVEAVSRMTERGERFVGKRFKLKEVSVDEELEPDAFDIRTRAQVVQAEFEAAGEHKKE